MLRNLYILILKLHPAPFRQRFGAEMLDIFDSTGRPPSLLLDGLISLVRQRGFRENTPQAVAADLPFQLLEQVPIRRAALLQGFLLTTILLLGMITTIGRANRGGPALVIATHHHTPRPVALDRDSFAEGTPDVQVSFPYAEDPWAEVASIYFKLVRVLRTLDRDRDLVLSAREIAAAPKVLSWLDRDQDGKLSTAELGFSQGHPILDALDADHDGELSAEELKNSPAALKQLDANRDGMLAPDEIMPQIAGIQASLIMSRIDANRDEQLSPSETDFGDPQIRALVHAADRNKDGTTTLPELIKEISIRRSKR
jgi:Ca2+-binding EF-hand superfamily protein